MKILILLLLCGGCLWAASAPKEIRLGREHWHELKFRGITANQVTYSADGLKVSVDKSASPLVYKMESEMTVVGFDVQLKYSGRINGNSATDFEEDSYFRLGLVATGINKLGAVSGLFAPNWVKELFKLAPPGLGLDKIYFFNVAALQSQVGAERQNPASEYIHERVIAARENGEQRMSYKLKTPLKIAALWISIDGDNTQSKFTTEIKSIKLETP